MAHLIVLLASILSLLLSTPASAKTLYVALTGSDSNSCVQAESASTPKRSLMNLLGSGAAPNCVASGDTVIVAAGEYTTADDRIFEVLPTSNANNVVLPSGTAIAPTIFRGAGKGVTIFRSPSEWRIYGGSYVVFEDLTIDGASCAGCNVLHFRGEDDVVTVPADRYKLDRVEIKNGADHGVFGNASNLHITHSHLHHNGNVIGAAGKHNFYMAGHSNGLLIEYSELNNGGNTGPGGSSGGQINCSIICSGAVFRYNYVHDNQSSGIAFRTTGAQVYGNVFKDNGGNGGITFWGNNTTNNKAYNNTIYSSSAGNGISVCNGASGCSGGDLTNNLIIATIPIAGNVSFYTETTNIKSTTLANITNYVVSTTNPILKAGSAAINAGSPSLRPCNGTCDVGAFETIPTPTVAAASGNTVDVTLPMNLSVPVLPASGQTTWVVKFGGTPRTTTANRHPTSDSVVRLTFSGTACTGTSDNITVDYTAGNVTDSSLVGNTFNQTLFSFTGLAVDESGCGGGGGTPPSGTTIIYHLNDASIGACCADSSGNANHGTITGTPSLVTGLVDGALDFTDQGGQQINVPFGSGFNPTSSSLTVCVLVAPDSTSARTLLGAPLGTNQRAYISINNGTWKIGVQGSNDGAGPNNDFPVSAGTYALPCIVFDHTASKATLWVNAVKGTTEDGTNKASIKPYTSYSFSGNFVVGNGSGFGNNNAMGGVVDEVFIYPSALNQTEMTDLYQSLINSSPPPPSSSREQKGHKFQRPFKKDGVAEDLRGVDEDGRVSRGGYVDVVIQIDCTDDDCPSFAPRLHRSIDGGATYAQINDVCGVICFRGASTNTDLVSADAECCLTGVLTENDGPTNFTSSAVPNITLSQDHSITLRYKLKVDASATPGQEIYLKVYDQNGNELEGGYTPALGAKLTVKDYANGGGF